MPAFIYSYYYAEHSPASALQALCPRGDQVGETRHLVGPEDAVIDVLVEADAQLFRRGFQSGEGVPCLRPVL